MTTTASPVEVSGRHGGVAVLDGSPEGEGVLDVACTWMPETGGPLSVVIVVPSSAFDPLAAGYLSRVTAGVASRRVDWEVLHGDVAVAVTEYARQVDAAFIAIRDGSAVARIARRSPLPVLVTCGREPRPPPRRSQVDRCQRPPAPPRPLPLRPAGEGRRPARRSAAHRAATTRQALVVTLAVLAGALAAGAVIPTPYADVGATALPADSFLATEPRHEHGQVMILVVDLEPLSVLEAVRAWIAGDGGMETVPDAASPDAGRIHRQAMRASALVALSVATQHLGLDAGDVHLDVDTGEIGGPSAGLAFAIAITDLLSPGDLTGGRRVAATGELTAAGDVRPVARIAEKAGAAQEAGVDVLVVPEANVGDAVLAAPGLTVVGVASFDEALAALAGP